MGDWKQVGTNLVRHKGGTYYLRAKVGGRLVRKSLGTDSIRAARTKRDELLDALRAELDAPGTLGEIVAAVGRRRLAKPALKPSTRKYYERLVRILRETLPVGQSARLWKPADAAEWWSKTAAEHSPPQANNLLHWARAVGAEIVERGLAARNPVNGLRTVRVRRSAVERLPSQKSVGEIIAAMRAMKHRSAAESADLCEWLAWTGMRPGEARAMRWEDVQADRIRVTGGEAGTKNHEARWVPIAEPLRAQLDRRRQKAGRVFWVSDPRKTFRAALKALKLPPMRLYDLRHVFATHAIESGVDIPTVAKWLGHQDGGALAMRTYGHIRDDHSLAEVRKLG